MNTALHLNSKQDKPQQRRVMAKGGSRSKSGGGGGGSAADTSATSNAAGPASLDTFSEGGNTPSQSQVVSASDQFLNSVSQEEARQYGLGGLWERVSEGNKVLKSNDFETWTPERQASWVDQMVLVHGAANATKSSVFEQGRSGEITRQIANLRNLQTEQMYNKLSSEGKDKLSRELARQNGNDIPRVRNPRMQGVFDDMRGRAERQIQAEEAARRAAKKARLAAQQNNNDSLF